MVSATVIAITLALVSAPWYQKLKCPFGAGPSARETWLEKLSVSKQDDLSVHLLKEILVDISLLSGFTTQPLQKQPALSWCSTEEVCPLLSLHKGHRHTQTQRVQPYQFSLKQEKHLCSPKPNSPRVTEMFPLFQESPILADFPFFQFLTELDTTIIRS